ncbi:MAG TPA: hypothetical protein VHY84_00545 [Bryobacteraceae bacterium]|jgi:hypothetical protein|nr:hypothetical protein [Bryobacteraceae bacterium]
MTTLRLQRRLERLEAFVVPASSARKRIIVDTIDDDGSVVESRVIEVPQRPKRWDATRKPSKWR